MASVGNQLPDGLNSYLARIETEIALLLRQENAQERVVFMTQIASDLYWDRDGMYDQHVIGQKSQQTTIGFSSYTFTPIAWVQPTLYGSRFRLRNTSASRQGGEGGAEQGMISDGADTMAIVHPLAPDRSNWYRYSGGDTVVTMHLPERTIPIVLIRVRPRDDLEVAAVLFDGEIGVDVSRGALVRVRGRFVRAGPGFSWPGTLGTAVAFMEIDQSERDGKYWLPYRQRIELQAAFPLFSDSRVVIRYASRIADLEINAASTDTEILSHRDSLRIKGRRRLTYASNDSLSRFNDWVWRPGELTEEMHSDDFKDVGPDRWRTTGRPRIEMSVPRFTDVLHYNRVEGFFVGQGARFQLRDVVPGLELRATAGYAFSDLALRGRGSILYSTNRWRYELRAGRSLDLTNDFRNPGDSGTSLLTALHGLDPYDYVDRRSTMLYATREFGKRRFLLRGEIGYADDRYRAATHQAGIFGDRQFRANRYVDAGGYLFTRGVLEWRPDVSAGMVKPGIGGRLVAESGQGALSWQRYEARTTMRKIYGPVVVASQVDAGIVTGKEIPPQQLFEIGKYQGLPGYGDKEFAGSQAALGRLSVSWLSPWLRSGYRIPWLLIDNIYPGLNPGLGFGVQAGWTGAPNAAVLNSISRFAPPDGVWPPRRKGMPTGSQPEILEPLSRPSGTVRGTVVAGVNFFSGLILAGYARPLGEAAPWQWYLGGQLR